MKTNISRLEIENEMDIVLAHRRAMQIAKFAGVNIADQTRLATAVSEICRNALEYCNSGDIEYSISSETDGEYCIEANVKDCGPGIAKLDEILKRNPLTYFGKGRGIVFSRKLVDIFKINSSSKGTNVLLGIHVRQNGTPINNLIIQGWVNQLKKEQPMNAYEELKVRNSNLMQLTEELRKEKETSEKQLAEIANLNTTLQKTNDYLEEFTYTVSHDLKTPLTSINLSLELMEDTEDLPSKFQYIDIISRAAKRLERTVHGLVDILDIQTRYKNIVKRIDIDRFYSDILEGFDNLISGKDISIEKNIRFAELCYVEPYLTSIFINLITNSIKYRKKEGPLSVNINGRKQNGYCVFTFTDNAEGIDLEKNGDRLFVPFIRFNNTVEGRGVGLYLIKKMVEKNDGKIEVESTPGKGSTFRLFLKEYTCPEP